MGLSSIEFLGALEVCEILVVQIDCCFMWGSLNIVLPLPGGLGSWIEAHDHRFCNSVLSERRSVI